MYAYQPQDERRGNAFLCRTLENIAYKAGIERNRNHHAYEISVIVHCTDHSLSFYLHRIAFISFVWRRVLENFRAPIKYTEVTYA